MSLAVRGQDVTSGPTKDEKVPTLKVYDVTGINKEKVVDYAATRKDKPTIYFLIPQETLHRDPLTEFMLKLDEHILAERLPDVYVVAVFLSDNADKTKEQLERIQDFVKLQKTALTVFLDDAAGLKAWNVNSDARLTVVLANKGKVVETLGYKSVKNTDVEGVKKALKKVVEKK